ncbi:MAG: hypothetical protein A2Y61_02985 [Chloroflexi bacterium RBG_13_60_13]|nr:MAG: hypothetical protein A2Y61_02985 [Chloroflexi bacterium RBG_13_60_13]
MLARILASVFLALHGLVHMLYFAQSSRIFELKSGMIWPVGSWVLTRPLGDGGTRTFTSVFCVLVAVGFVLGAVGLLSGQPWWRATVVASAMVSAVLFLLCWNGQLQNIDGQGAVGLVLDAIILVTVLVFRWP